MERELERFHKESTQLKLNITQLQQKLKAADREMHRERQKVWGTTTVQVVRNEVCGDRTVQKQYSKQTGSSGILCPRTRRVSGQWGQRQKASKPSTRLES